MTVNNKPERTMKDRTYLTPETVSALQPGTVLKLGYDDFNSGKFTYTHQRCASGRGGRVEAIGMADYGDGDTFELTMYQFNGPHRGGSFTPLMVRGSGAERVFIVGNGKAKAK